MNDELLKYMSDQAIEIVSQFDVDNGGAASVLQAIKEVEPDMTDFILEGRVNDIIRTHINITNKQSSERDTRVAERIVKQSIAESYMVEVKPWHILLACFDYARGGFTNAGFTRHKLLVNIIAYMETIQVSALDMFCVDLTAKANTMYDPIIGRDKEIASVIRVLARRTKPNVSLIGEPGIGKSAIAIGLAQRIENELVPDKLKGWRVYALDLALLAAGASMAGEYERRVTAILDEIRRKEETVVLFIDELHRIVGAGGNGSQDAANLLKPALARGELHVLGATTLNEYREYIEKDGALERRFQPIIVQEPTVPQTIEILEGVNEYYANFHGVTFAEQAIEKAVELGAKYILHRRFPDKAIDVMDEAAAVASLSGKKQVSVDDMCAIVASLTGIPVETLNVDEKERLANIEMYIHRRLIGQETAVKAVSASIRRSRTGLNNGKRPIGSFMFLGPTGVGKTELAKTLAEFMFQNDSAVIRMDMSEYQEHHTVSRLFGAPPGYVGYNQGGQLTEAVRRKPYSVVLFDEIEKAHEDVFNVLLQILDEGRLTDSSGRVVDFTNTIIIMTSNIAPELWRNDSANRQQIESALLKKFRPEFINRIDEIAVFKHLSFDQICAIAALRLNDVAQLAKEQGYTITFSDKMPVHLAKLGFHDDFGARPLNRAITGEVANRLAREIAEGHINAGDTVSFDVKRDEIILTV